MNRVVDQNTHRTENDAERDYLFLLFAAIIRFLARPRVRIACTALSIVAVFLCSLGIVGGVETGALPFICLVPLLGLWALGAIGAYRARG